MLNRTSLALACAALVATVATPAQAQYKSAIDGKGSYSATTPTASSSGFEAAGVPSSGKYEPAALPVGDGNLAVTPTVGISAGHNDNMGRSNVNRRSSGFIVLTPAIYASSQLGSNKYSLGYQGEYTTYQSSSRDNTKNHEVAASGEHDLDTRFALNWRASFLDRFDPAGSTDRAAGSSGEPDHWKASNWALVARYGAKSAPGRIFLEVGEYDKEYKNNRDSTAASDYKSTNSSLRFVGRLSGKTNFTAEYRLSKFNYKLNTSDLDNYERRALVGLEWEATAATTGSFKVGNLRKNYSSARRDFSGATYEGGLRWAPLTYSRVDLSVGRSASDTTGNNGDYLLSSFGSAKWTHDWRSYFSTRVSMGQNKTKYEGDARKDTTYDYGIGVDYVLTRNAKLSADLQRSTRNSNSDTFDYDLNLVSTKLELAF
jgi:polysaccharide biosynthesis protein VpsM